MRARVLDGGLAAYALVCLGAVSWPGATWLDRAEPFVLGLPRAFAWNIGWVALTFVVLVGYHALRRGSGAGADGRET